MSRLSLAQKIAAIGLGIFFLLGVSFRIFLANKLSFTYDELWAYHYANQQHSVWDHLVSPFDDRPPVHYLLLRLQSSVSNSILWLRLPSIVCSAVVLLLAAAAARKVNRRFAVAILLFGVVSYSSVRYATLARDYGFIVLAAWLQIHSIWTWIKPNGKSEQKELTQLQILQWLFAALLGTGLNYVYLPFLVSLMAGVVMVWLRLYQQKLLSIQTIGRRIGILFAATVPTVFLVTYYLFVYNQFATILGTTEWIRQPTVREVLDLLTIHLGLGTYVSWSGMVFGSTLLVAGLYKAWRNTHDRSFIVFSLTTIGVNIAGLIIVSLLGSSFFLIRYFAPLSVVSLLFISYIGWRLWEATDRPVQFLLLVWFFIAYVPFMVSEMNNRLGFYGSLEKYGIEHAKLVQTIKNEWRPGDQLVFSPKSYGVLYRDFYFNSPHYESNAKIAELLDPIDNYACEKRTRLNFPADTKLIVAAVSDKAYDQPENILISETTTHIYPDYEVPLNQLCESEPVSIFRMNQTAIWTCTLKQEVRLTQYCYLPQ